MPTPVFCANYALTHMSLTKPLWIPRPQSDLNKSKVFLFKVSGFSLQAHSISTEVRGLGREDFVLGAFLIIGNFSLFFSHLGG